MGCCTSRLLDDDILDSSEDPVPRGGNKPFTKKGLSWTSDSPITINQLKKQRDAFWDTAPSYEGRLEIWQAIRCACESDDIILSQAVIDTANITIPTGNLAEGCYDELDRGIDDMNSKLLSEHTKNNEKPIKIRLSNSSNDIIVNINPKLDTIAILKAKLCINQGLDVKKFNVRILFLGRLLDDKLKFSDLALKDGQLLQGLITEK
ncbi:968_t:CDS:2 [Entrophospora sp. SA101]|nr:968_t:CDS:2 [Entrophospora sp. SA101]CAJ0832640.1 16339_t:CDS:2 [Entrophospora sp. SA101]CAJ0927565.1 8617_t:CDS:2 [Entrophospora sp. SA101]